MSGGNKLSGQTPLHECSQKDLENAPFSYSHKQALNLALPRKKTLRRTKDSCSWRSRCPEACFLSLPSAESFKIIHKRTRHMPARANTQISSGRLPAYLRNFLFACAITCSSRKNACSERSLFWPAHVCAYFEGANEAPSIAF